MTAIWRFWD